MATATFAVALGCSTEPIATGQVLSRQDPLPTAVTKPAEDKPVGRCGGQAQACTELNKAQSCGGQQGCQWQADACLDGSCDQDADEGACRQAGCRYQTGCTGLAVACVTLTDATACARQVGCAWADGSCTGAPRRCINFNVDPSGCLSQRGCYGGSTCTPWNVGLCAQIAGGETPCKAALRCTWAPAACQGAALGCEELVSEASCKAQAGCSWQLDG